MQIQVECNHRVGQQHICWTCRRSFTMQEAQVIICNDYGTRCGEVCPSCIHKGFGWLNSQFELLNTSKKPSVVLSSKASTPVPVASR